MFLFISNDLLFQNLKVKKFNNFRNSPVSCESSMFSTFDFNAWRDSEKEIQLPITEATIQKVFKLAELNIKEQRRRESHNIQKSNYKNIAIKLKKNFFN